MSGNMMQTFQRSVYLADKTKILSVKITHKTCFKSATNLCCKAELIMIYESESLCTCICARAYTYKPELNQTKPATN